MSYLAPLVACHFQFAVFSIVLILFSWQNNKYDPFPVHGQHQKRKCVNGKCGIQCKGEVNELKFVGPVEI